MEILKILTLSALISLSSSLNEGLKSFEQKKYDQAIEQLSAVVNNKDDQQFKDIALFYRAQAFHANGQKEKALSDIIELIKFKPTSEYSIQARKLYLEWGGKITDLPPDLSPIQVWQKFVVCASKNDFESAKAYGTEHWNSFINNLLEFIYPDVHMYFLPFLPSEEVYSTKDLIKTAKLLFKVPISNPEVEQEPMLILEFILDTEKNSWLINDVSGIIGNELKTQVNEFLNDNIGEPDIHFPAGSPVNNVQKLKMIGLGLRMYAQEYNEVFPPNLNELITGGYLEDENIIFWTDKTTNKKAMFMYRPGFTENDDVDIIIAASPAPTNGKREVLYLDGHVELLLDEDFRKKVAKQGWKFSGLVYKDEIPAEKQEEIRKIIRKLADNDPKVRKEAKKQLSEMGVEALPILEEFVNDPDPEIKVNVKELLSK